MISRRLPRRIPALAFALCSPLACFAQLGNDPAQKPAAACHSDSPRPGAEFWAPLPPRMDGKKGVFVAESENLVAGTPTAAADSGNSIHVMSALAERCGDKVVVVRNPEDADIFLRFDRDRGAVLLKSNKMVAFDRSGELVFAGTQHTLSTGVKRFCDALPQPQPAPSYRQSEDKPFQKPRPVSARLSPATAPSGLLR